MEKVHRHTIPVLGSTYTKCSLKSCVLKTKLFSSFPLSSTTARNFLLRRGPNQSDKLRTREVVMEEEYDSTMHQLHVLDELNALKMTDYLDGRRTAAEAFQVMIKEINLKFRHIPKELQTDLYRRQMLLNAVRKQEWASPDTDVPIKHIRTYDLLCRSLSNRIHKRCLWLKEHGQPHEVYGTTEPSADIPYNNAESGKQIRSRMHKTHEKSDNACFICGELDHWKWDCHYKARGRRIFNTLCAKADERNPQGQHNGKNVDNLRILLRAIAEACDTDSEASIDDNNVLFAESDAETSDMKDELLLELLPDLTMREIREIDYVRFLQESANFHAKNPMQWGSGF